MAVDLATGAVSYAGLLTPDAVPLAVDAKRAIYTTDRCDARRPPVLAFENTISPAPSALDPVLCPVEILTRTATLHLRERRATVRLGCPQGCLTDWNVRYGSQDVGILSFAAPPGAPRTATVHVRDIRPFLHRATAVVRLAADPGLTPGEGAAHSRPSVSS